MSGSLRSAQWSVLSFYSQATGLASPRGAATVHAKSLYVSLWGSPTHARAPEQLDRCLQRRVSVHDSQFSTAPNIKGKEPKATQLGECHRRTEVTEYKGPKPGATVQRPSSAEDVEHQAGA